MELVAPGERFKLYLLSLLLLLMLGIVCFAAVGTYKAVQNFQQRNNALEAGDVSTMRGWMTIHVVARLYHVPEDYLSSTLDIANPEQVRHFTLNQIASTKRQPVSKLIQALQHAILNFRKIHHIGVRLISMKHKSIPERMNKKPPTGNVVSTLILHNELPFQLRTTGRT